MLIIRHDNSYTLELTPLEFHDLVVIAGIPDETLQAALKLSTAAWIDRDTQTHNVYGLVHHIQNYAEADAGAVTVDMGEVEDYESSLDLASLRTRQKTTGDPSETT
jgi:hypothetical protein